MRDDSYKDSFKDFNYYFNEVDPNDKNNSKEKKFFNPHLNIPNAYYRNSIKENVTTTKTYEREEKIEKILPNSLETKFSKIKLMSSSGSSNSLIRNYRQSSGNIMSNNSTSSSNHNAHRRSGSAANLNY